MAASPRASRNALLEEIVYDGDGNILTASLADYLPPTCAEIPQIEIRHIVTESDATLTRAKGLGEGGAIGAPAAVINAISDALKPFGVGVFEMPATPQRIRALIRAAQAEGGAMTTRKVDARRQRRSATRSRSSRAGRSPMRSATTAA